jgi:hypothetical protein
MSGERVLKVVKECINQDTGKRLYPGDIVRSISIMEMSRHTAEGNMIPVTKKDTTEKAIMKPRETRTKPRPKKKSSGLRKKITATK